MSAPVDCIYKYIYVYTDMQKFDDQLYHIVTNITNCGKMWLVGRWPPWGPGEGANVINDEFLKYTEEMKT